MKRNPHSLNEEVLRQILREQRLKISLRQKDLAMALEVPQSFISKYESGERLLTFSETITICIALDLSPELLLQRYLCKCR
jgi:transcriptional regulator with XRE-family HTH domain